MSGTSGIHCPSTPARYRSPWNLTSCLQYLIPTESGAGGKGGVSHRLNIAGVQLWFFGFCNPKLLPRYLSNKWFLASAHTLKSWFNEFRAWRTFSQECPWASVNVNSQGRTNYFQAAVSRLQVNALRAAFLISGRECKTCALLLALIWNVARLRFSAVILFNFCC